MDTSRLANWLANDPLWQRIAELLHGYPDNTWLVGGTVRDVLLGRPSADIDLTAERGALNLGRSLARALSASFFPLDAARGVGRVILPGKDCHIDVADLRACDILADLRARDLTINAMAVPAREPGVILDPTGGLADLDRRVLRAASPRAFMDDPLRILRCFRQQMTLGYHVEEATLALIPAALPLLESVSMERLRDELMLVLALNNASAALERLEALRVLGTLIPRLMLPDDSHLDLATLRALETWLNLGSRYGLDEWYARLLDDWQAPLAAGRPRQLMVRFAALLAELSEPEQTQRAGSALCLSSREILHVRQCVSACRELESGCAPASALERYLFFKRHGAAGLDGALLSVCRAKRTASLAVCELFAAWYTRYDREVEPPALLSGDDLRTRFGLTPGPVVGRLLENLRQAQVSGLISTSAQAERYLSALIQSSGQGPAGPPWPQEPSAR